MRWNRAMTVVGCHTGGEIGDVVIGGLPHVPGGSLFEKKLYMEEELDHLRQLLLFQPRGSVLRSVNFVLPPSDPAAQMGYVIAETTEYPVMSGSNTICTATVLLETGMVEMVEPETQLVLESPAGLIPLRCECRDGKVTSVRFVNQPAFVYHLDAQIEVPGYGQVRADVAWGGMAYVIVEAADLGFELNPAEASELCRVGQLLKAAAAEQLTAVHPLEPRYAGITQAEFTGPLRREGEMLVSQNAVIVSPGRVDRSPCGTGTSARLAVLHAKGLVDEDETFVHESLIGSRYVGRVESLTTVGDLPAVVPSIAGEAFITSIAQVGLDPADPFPSGYLLEDT
jgi:proline racemase